ncbi:MAG: DUF2442 domain-containing protein [Betaproteobacteria bacterium]|nr:DUF2442 domain-containing protein [Betaproteobacteria bacterium]
MNRPPGSRGGSSGRRGRRFEYWILIDDEEFALPYAEFPWFRNATVDQILTVERPTADHLYWPKLDIDLAVASIKNPDAFPLVARSAGQG